MIINSLYPCKLSEGFTVSTELFAFVLLSLINSHIEGICEMLYLVVRMLTLTLYYDDK